MKVRDVLGHIDCPTCNTSKGMRITLDKNGEPFGYCEAQCHQQLRIGGDKNRVSRFLARFPWARPDAAPVTAGAPTPAPAAPRAPAAKAPAPAPAPEEKVVPRRSSLEDAIRFLGGQG